MTNIFVILQFSLDVDVKYKLKLIVYNNNLKYSLKYLKENKQRDVNLHTANPYLYEKLKHFAFILIWNVYLHFQFQSYGWVLPNFSTINHSSGIYRIVDNFIGQFCSYDGTFSTYEHDVSKYIWDL